MKCIKYTRIESTDHIHNTIYIDVIYIDDLNISLYKERLGSFSNSNYGILKNETLISEAKDLFNDKLELDDNFIVKFKNIVKFKLDEDDDIIEIINNIKEYEKNKQITFDFIDKLITTT